MAVGNAKQQIYFLPDVLQLSLAVCFLKLISATIYTLTISGQIRVEGCGTHVYKIM